ncbi:DMT family transporter [Pseudooceanicola sp. CBS1P-1]|uniref:EamA family transporter n=1 Tax=Pseudooceanicola albus TaxID=2692189 RepID=A0A6L7GC82_9RHOB|nr:MULTISPECIES: DMT family transporter [Pseudooceanicola]MBT9386702.1 DMT family transporter [Pseudooceanicola endophyticus]MXN20886.1 EamA family transporter [Pseudooceanicola albus]
MADQTTRQVLPEGNHLAAAALLLVTGLALPGLNAMVKYLGPDYSIVQLLWLRYAGHFLFLVVLFLPRYGLGLFRTRRPGLQMARSLCFFMGSMLVFLGLQSTDMALATAIQFTSPIMVTALAPLLLREPVGPVRLGAVLLGFVGALIVVRPQASGLAPGEILLLVSALTGALGQILSRRLAGHDPALTSTVYMVVLGFVIISVPLPFFWRWPDTGMDALLFALLGLVGGLGHYCLLRAYQMASAAFVAPLFYFQIIGAAVFGFLVFGALPDAMTLLGSAVIIGSGLMITARELRQRRRRQTTRI